jgi:hypothetical protein
MRDDLPGAEQIVVGIKHGQINIQVCYPFILQKKTGAKYNDTGNKYLLDNGCNIESKHVLVKKLGDLVSGIGQINSFAIGPFSRFLAFEQAAQQLMLFLGFKGFNERGLLRKGSGQLLSLIQ